VTDAPTWTILVPTLGQRAELFERLMGALLPQLDPYEGRARVVAWWNNGDPPLADLRQAMLEGTATDYVSFFDDDDEPAPDLVDRVMTALASRPDYVGWQTAYSSDGVDHGLVDHSLRHGGWREVKKPTYQLLRDITHINPMRTDVAKRGDFRKKTRAGRAEDRPWVDQIRATHALKTEVYIPAPMYFYRWRRDTSAWQRPHLIERHHQHRPQIDHPYFAWHPRSAGTVKTSEGAIVPELLIIIPTRGRPQNVTRVIEAWQATGAFEVANVLFAVDEDDPELERYLAIPAHPQVAITVAERVPMAPRTNIEAARFADRFYALGSAGDDHVPETAGWAQRYLEELKRLGSGIVFGDDGFQHGKLCTEWAMTSDIVRALDGRLIPAPVDHLYSDNSVYDLGKVSGMMSYLPEIKITHYHPAAGRAQSDEGYQRVNSRGQYASDGEAFKRWRRLQLPGDVSKLRALRPLVAPTAMPSGRPKHRTTLGVRRGGVINSRPTTSLNVRRDRPVMRMPRPIRMVRGLTSDEALLSLADMARQVPADEAIVELGVYQGKSALTLAWGASQGNHAHVWAVDPWELYQGVPVDLSFMGGSYGATNTKGTRRWAEHNVRALGYSRSITLIQGHSRSEGQAWQGPPIGLLFIDGDHSYEAVQGDLLTWAEHMAPGGTIVFDDYVSNWEDTVIRGVDELVQVGILERPQLHAGRLAVTRLTEGWEERRDAFVDASTRTLDELEQASQEGAQAAAGYLDVPVANMQRGGVTEPGDNPHVVAELPDPDEELEDLPVRPNEAARLVVAEGAEADATNAPAGTSIEELNTVQLRALAKARGIKLGVRKDKRDSMVDALKAGE
jgi:predicted O-methyltransferase YrrM